MKNNKLKHKLIFIDDEEYHIIMYNSIKISIGDLPKIIGMLTKQVLNNLHGYGGKVIIKFNKNLIYFPSEEKTLEAIAYLESLVTMNKLTD